MREKPLYRHTVRTVAVLLTLAALVIGGHSGWQAYEDHKRAEAWKSVMDGMDCSTCAARKAGMAAKQKKRRAAQEAGDPRQP